MSKTVEVKRLEQKTINLKHYVQDLKMRHDRAITTLGDLSAGFGKKVENNTKREDWMMHLASSELANIAKMQLRVTDLYF